MHPLLLIPLTALVLAVVDLPWLLYGGGQMSIYVIEKIQKAPIRFYMPAAILVYLALAYLVNLTRKPETAFMIGLTTYAVYDFTNLATFSKYTSTLAVIDSLWGGFLCLFARLILNTFS